MKWRVLAKICLLNIFIGEFLSSKILKKCHETTEKLKIFEKLRKKSQNCPKIVKKVHCVLFENSKKHHPTPGVLFSICSKKKYTDPGPPPLSGYIWNQKVVLRWIKKSFNTKLKKNLNRKNSGRGPRKIFCPNSEVRKSTWTIAS